jgi:hypothetical protein
MTGDHGKTLEDDITMVTPNGQRPYVGAEGSAKQELRPRLWCAKTRA